MESKLFQPGPSTEFLNNSNILYPPESIEQAAEHLPLVVIEPPKLFAPGACKNLYIDDTNEPRLYPPESFDHSYTTNVLDETPKLFLPGECMNTCDVPVQLYPPESLEQAVTHSKKVEETPKLFPPGPSVIETDELHPHCKMKGSHHRMCTHICPSKHSVNSNQLVAMTNRRWFYGSEIASIYSFPKPDTSRNITIGVISFGGGLYGNVASNGVLTNGDVQAYWTKCGISSEQHPRVIVVPLFGANNELSDGGTEENTLDVEMIGCACPSSKLTIILYLAPNSLSNFQEVVQYAITTSVNGNSIPTILSVSWAASELYDYGSLENVLKNAADRGINIFVASGDYGSTDTSGNVSTCNYPSSSPSVISCGGTNLVCPSMVYNNSTTKETTWTGSGGGISKIYPKPSYQSTLSGGFRQIPDISLDADPSTGIAVLLNGNYVVYGGTSFVAPLMAGFLATINVSKFINPLLYSAPKNCFYDILSGSNGTYSAKTGYDPCTGLGSVNGAVLSQWLSSTPQIINVSSISVSPVTVTLPFRQMLQLKTSILPAGATNKSVTWASSDISVCTVSNTGLVTSFIKPGSSLITVTSDDGGIKSTSTITVSKPIVRVSSIKISPSTVKLSVNQTYQINPTIIPSNTDNKSVTWSSSNTNIATVSSSGLVTTLSSGSVIITAKTVDGSKTATLTVSIKAAVNVNVSSISVAPSTIQLMAGQTYQITPVIAPLNATNKSILWSSSNTNIAYMSSTGLVTAVSNGSVVVTARTIDGIKSAKVTIQVGPSSSSLKRLFVPRTIPSMNTNIGRLGYMKVLDPDIDTTLVVKSYMKYKK